MPGFLKSLFKPSDKRRHHQSGPLPPGVSFSPTSPTSGQDEITHLAALLQDKLNHGTHDPSILVQQLQQQNGNPAEPQRLMQALKIIAGEDGRVSPYFTEGGASSSRSSRRTRTRGIKSASHGDDQWTMTNDACSAAQSLVESLIQKPTMRAQRKSLARLQSLLEAQQEELLDLRPYAEGHGAPTLSTLTDIYHQVKQGLSSLTNMSEAKQVQTLETLVQVLAEGPDYLIDITLVEAIVWQGEVIDSGFGADIQQILDKAILEQANDPATFTRAVESIIAVSSALPRDLLDDMEAIDAYKSIGILLNQLQVRLGTPSQVMTDTLSRHSSVQLPLSVDPSTVATPQAVTPEQSPLVSPASTRSTTPDPNFVNFSNASDLQQMYGTGPMPTPSRTSSTPQAGTTSATPRPPPSPTDTEASQEIWEYRGNLLTRSALSLVMRQEALARADSSGQYAGEVSWDDVRNAWIPKWAAKMKPEDLADGELANPNPAEFKVKREDAWGNKIGWRDGVMYYKEEPNFDNVPD